MKKLSILLPLSLIVLCFPINLQAQKIQFPDIPGYRTLKCDLHMHTVFSDGSVWPDIRVREALSEGLDAISITDHIEYQPHKNDINHPDRNRSYQIALYAARDKDLMIINGAEITRSMPPGHLNAIFVEDVNKLMDEDVAEVLREAKAQGAFVFWNHPHWTAQQENGVASLGPMMQKFISKELVQGIEVYNEYTYSDEVLDIANEHGLAIMGNSDIHGLIHSTFGLDEGGHRPITLVFAKEKSEEGLKEALQEGRTGAWFDNTLVGKEPYLSSLVNASISCEKKGSELVQEVSLRNLSDVDYILENTSTYNFHNTASVFILKAHSKLSLFVKTLEKKDEFSLSFQVLNAFTAPGRHPEIEYLIK